ncbi:MAG: acid phosphatase, partial [OM182 bacterium]|nr:acid phosphatase [OM182 bacterium]
MLNRILRTGVAAAAILGALATPVTAAESERESANAALTNPLLYAIAWRQTAAEFRALYYQGFALAQLRVEQALAAREAGAENDTRPLAVITDVDETVLLSGAYWGQLIAEGGDFFDDATWDAWVPNNEFVASPGAREFAAFCEANGVTLFFVTNRDQGEATFELALGNLRAAGFENVRAENLRVLRETSNKEAVQAQIRSDYRVIASLGDNLNDFARRYYVIDVAEREALMHADAARFGTDYIVFPNPTDGHWIRAIFG